MPVKHAQQGGRFQHAVCPEVQLVCGGPLKPRGYPFGKGPKRRVSWRSARVAFLMFAPTVMLSRWD
jgi:hypothetical protein